MLKYFLSICIVVFFAVGCSEGRMGAVTGSVKIDGQPVPEGLILRFTPQTPPSSPSMGVTDESGNFEAKFSFNKKGVMVGPCAVTFEVGRPSEGPKPDIKLPPNYVDGQEERVEIKSGKQKFDFNLLSK